VVVEDRVGVEKLLVFELSAVPPVAAAYQSVVAPLLAVALRVRLPLPQMLAGVEAVTVGKALTVATTAVRADDTQPVVVFRASA
jgi:hypothetical protein